MGIIAPWRSELQQVVGGAPQAASFKSPSDFMGPGGGDNGLAALARGLGQLSGAAFELGIQERQTQQEIALLEEIQGLQLRTDEFENNEMANNRGKNGIGARKRFQDWFENEAAEIDKKWAGVGLSARKYLTHHVGNIGVRGLDRMGRFGLEQQNDHMLSVANGGVSLAYQEAQRDPANYLNRLNPALDDLAAALRKTGKSDEEIAAKTQALRHGGLEVAALSLGEAGAFEAADRLLNGDYREEGAGFINPLGGGARLSSGFGLRTPPETNWGRGSRNHQGHDYAAPEGTPVAAAKAGRVSFVGRNGGYGLMVMIDHGDGTETRYGHLSDVGDLKAGQEVGLGQPIALSGGRKDDPNSGNSRGPHLHFEIRRNGKPLDPSKEYGGGMPNSKRREIQAKLDKMRDDAVVKSLGDEAAEAYQSGSEAEIAEQQQRSLDEINKVDDPDRRHAMANAYQKEISFQQMRRDASDMAAKEAFLSLAADNGWSPAEMQANLKTKEGFSRAGKEALAAQIDDGTVTKVTWTNLAALDQLRIEIEQRRRNKNPMSAEEVRARAQAQGMTVGQAQEAEKYRVDGGMAGVDGFAGKVNAFFKEMTANTANPPAGFIDAVAHTLPAGKTPTPEELRNAVGVTVLNFMKGESMSGKWYLPNKNETYFYAHAAVREGRAGDTWLPTVDSDEIKRITLEMQARMAAGQIPTGPINNEVIRTYKRVHIMGLPPIPTPAANQSRPPLPQAITHNQTAGE